MTIKPVSSSVNHAAPVQPQKQPVNTKEVANNKGGSTVAAQVVPHPSVNTSGQSVGNHINTKA